MIDTFTVEAYVDGHKIGGQKDADLKDIRDLISDERGWTTEHQDFIDDLLNKGKAVVVDKYKIMDSDPQETTSVLVAWAN